MNLKQIYIYCPGNVLTGGINSLHNLCAGLCNAGFHAGMVYYDSRPEILNHDQIRSYRVPSFEKIIDTADHLLIVSETETLFLQQFKSIRKMVYWLGMNNYFKRPPFRKPFTIKAFRKLIACRNYFGYSAGIFENMKRKLSWWSKSADIIWQEDILHMSNSYYVANCCLQRGIRRVPVLHNPVRDEFYLESGETGIKEPKIIFGPKTPKLLIFLCRLNFSYKIVRLKHLAPEEVKQHLKESRVFAEFGNNSGRDRMPREAALLHCIVLANTRGSAVVYQDLAIPDRYKIPDHLFNYPKIIKLLKFCMENYSSVVLDFNEYVHTLEEEKRMFAANVKLIFMELANSL